MRLGRFDNRLTTGFAAVCLLLTVIVGRLVQLQGVDHAGYANAAAEQRVSSITLNALRGQIVDRDGTVMAYTTSAQDITVDPTQVEEKDRAVDAAKLAPLLGKTEQALVALLATPGRYAVLAQALPTATANKVEDLGLTGIYTQATTQREYPGKTTGANIVGLVHSDGTGAAGVEYAYNNVLAGTNGSLTYIGDVNGNINPNGASTRKASVNGGTVKLTVDQALQFTIQQYLTDAVKASGARGGQVAVLTKTGQVLALASTSTFNSADANSLSADAPSNPPIQTVFEPGSVGKVITLAAAIDKGLITPSTVINVPTTLQTGGVTIHDAWWHPAEDFTATGVLAESSNVGTLKIAEKIGPQVWDQYAKAFGVGQATGIELPGESAGYIPPIDQWSDSTFANLPFGQGESMTVLQLASMYQTIANGGVRIAPRIVDSVTAQNGTTTMTQQPAGVRVVSEQTAETVRTMLESVIMPGGTGTLAAVPGYRVAGKTGTAQQPDPAHGGAYSSTMNWDTFAGMVPADDPQFVISIMIDNPAHGAEGGDVAAPLFHDIAAYELQHAGILPTGSLSKHVPLQICTSGTLFYSPSTVC
jgi:cell division protein FtsI (penicillin-binding protein 3)